MKFPKDMKAKDRVEFLERYILIHSYLYYEMNESIITDKRFDHRARLLADKIQKYGEKKIASTQYGYVFYDFDGSTGFDLLDRLNEKDKDYIEDLAIYIFMLYKKGYR